MRFQICNLYNTQLAPVVEASRYPPRKSESSQRTTGVEALWAQKKGQRNRAHKLAETKKNVWSYDIHRITEVESKQTIIIQEMILEIAYAAMVHVTQLK